MRCFCCHVAASCSCWVVKLSSIVAKIHPGVCSGLDTLTKRTYPCNLGYYLLLSLIQSTMFVSGWRLNSSMFNQLQPISQTTPPYISSLLPPHLHSPSSPPIQLSLLGVVSLAGWPGLVLGARSGICATLLPHTGPGLPCLQGSV